MLQWEKVVRGMANPVMAEIAEIVRTAAKVWESAETFDARTSEKVAIVVDGQAWRQFVAALHSHDEEGRRRRYAKIEE